MGNIVSDFEDILLAIETVPQEGRLFCFFAFDDRPSHRAILDFLADSRYWIDSLSATSGIFTLLFSHKWEQFKEEPGWMGMERPLKIEEGEFLDTLEKEIVYQNPSLELAKKFGVKPRSLPGLIVFQGLPSESPAACVYVPLSSSWFQNNQEATEAHIAEIYSRIQDAYEQHRGAGKEQLINEIGRALAPIGWAVEPLVPPMQSLRAAITEADEHTSSQPYPGTRIVPYVSQDEAGEVQIFISYAREDKEKAEFLYERLSEAGFRPWMDTRDILPGERWETAIERAIRSSQFFVACLSQTSVQKRGYVQREFREALEIAKGYLDSDVYLIPVRFDEAKIPEHLQGFQWIDFSLAWGGWGGIMEAIKVGLQRRQDIV